MPRRASIDALGATANLNTFKLHSQFAEKNQQGQFKAVRIYRTNRHYSMGADRSNKFQSRSFCIMECLSMASVQAECRAAFQSDPHQKRISSWPTLFVQINQNDRNKEGYRRGRKILCGSN